MRILVVGGGISGQLVKLRVPSARVLDWRPPSVAGGGGMTRRYGGNYLWEPLEGVECRPLTVYTTVDGAPPVLDAIYRYKEKVGKHAERITDMWALQFRAVQHGYDIVDWPHPIEVEYGNRVTGIDLHQRWVTIDGRADEHYDVLVSTIPLYSLMSLAGMTMVPFEWKPIFVRVQVNPLDIVFEPDVWRVNYLSDPLVPAYRTTDRDGERHFEALAAHGNIPSKKITPGKIYAHPSTRGILERLESMGVYCFGRFARWEPDELVHQTDARIRAWKKEMAV